jgi:ribosome-associated toxin RatA of RatAB toxin-antitoxin module
MAILHGSKTVEIEAPIADVYRVAADPSGAPEWQPEFKSAEVLEKDTEGNQTLMLMKVDLKVRAIDTKVRFSYDEPSGLNWTQESGPLKSVDGRWEFEDLGDGRTRATCTMDVDLGRLGLLVRGPLVGVLRGTLIESMPGKLKKYVEASN